MLGLLSWYLCSLFNCDIDDVNIHFHSSCLCYCTCFTVRVSVNLELVILIVFAFHCYIVCIIASFTAIIASEGFTVQGCE